MLAELVFLCAIAAASGAATGGASAPQAELWRAGRSERRLLQADCDPPAPAQRLYVYDDFNFTHEVTTTAPETQRLFDQGLLSTANYNQLEARLAFAAALTYDARCAMCFWGLAHALGPFQNKPAAQPFPDGTPGAGFDRYTEDDMRNAADAIDWAAGLVDLVRWPSEDAQERAARRVAGFLSATAGAYAPTLEQILDAARRGSAGVAAAKGHDAPGGSTAAAAATAGAATAGPEAGGGGASGPRRLIETLGPCQSGYTAGSAAAASAAGAVTGAAGGGGGGSSAAGASGHRRTELWSQDERWERDRWYIAAMHDRVSVYTTYGAEWASVERRYAGDLMAIADCWLDDGEAPSLSAEALGNLTPWDFYDPVTGSPRETTPLALAAINASLARAPTQPLALHLNIHYTEELPPGRGPDHVGVAEPSADLLYGLQPAFDHLQHMPSHTFLRVGRYDDAVEANVAALRAAILNSHTCIASTYPDHNTAMLVFAASMGADGDRALVYAKVLRELPRFVRDAPAPVGSLWPTPLLVWVRFAAWKQLLQEPPPPVRSRPSADGGGGGDAGLRLQQQQQPWLPAGSSDRASSLDRPLDGGGGPDGTEGAAAAATAGAAAAAGSELEGGRAAQLPLDQGSSGSTTTAAAATPAPYASVPSDWTADPRAAAVLLPLLEPLATRRTAYGGSGRSSSGSSGSSGSSSHGGGAAVLPYSLAPPLGFDDYSMDGKEYSIAMWRFARVMALAGGIGAKDNHGGAGAGAGGSAGAGAGGNRKQEQQLRRASTQGGDGQQGLAQEEAAARRPQMRVESSSGAGAGGDAAVHRLYRRQGVRGRRRGVQQAYGSATSSGAVAGDPSLLSAAAAALRRARVRALPYMSYVRGAHPELVQEFEALQSSVADVPPDMAVPPGQGLGINVPGYALLAAVAEAVAEARVAMVGGDLAAAVESMQRAVDIEDSGGYFEPPRQHQPSRQCLGWVLLRAGQLREALQAYLDDLYVFPDNPWSVRGLHTALAHAARSLALQQQQHEDGSSAAGRRRAAATATVAAAEGEELDEGDNAVGGVGGVGGGSSNWPGAARAQRADAFRAATALLRSAELRTTVAEARRVLEAVGPAARLRADTLKSSCPAFSQHK